MTFEELKEKVAESYGEYFSELSQEEQSELFFSDIEEADTLINLANVLDAMGFNGEEAYLFIIKSILE
jgi:hypothetical protein